MKSKKILSKLGTILTNKEKKGIYKLFLLLLIGAIFEMISLGVLLPVLAIIIKTNPEQKYPALKTLINILGNPTKNILIIWCLIFVIFIYIIKTVYLIFLAYRQNTFTSKLSSRISNDLFEGYMKMPYFYYLIRNSSELLRNIQQEILQFSGVTQAFITMGIEVTVVIGIASSLFIIEPSGTLIILFFFAITSIISHRLTKRKLTIYGEKRQTISLNTNQILIESFAAIKEIKLLDSENYFSNKYKRLNKNFSEIQAKVNTIGQLPRLYLELMSMVTFTLLIMFLVLQNRPIENLFPILAIFLAAAFRLIPSTNRILVSLQQIKYAESVINILHEEITKIKEFKQTLNIYTSNNETKLLRLENINFSYIDSGENKSVLNNISISINHNDIIGIIGTSGAGKTTLLNILLGLLNPKSGHIYLNNDIFQNYINEKKQLFGYVPQNIYLIDDSILKNIAFGICDDKIDIDYINEVLKMAQLFDFVYSLPEKLNTFVGESGVRLSGGQRQRIGIARALYNNPKILVLDEATSALDNDTELELLNSVLNLKNERTIIIVAHRLTTLDFCNKIYELNKGVLKERTNTKILTSKK